MLRVLERERGSAGYLSKEHVWRVLDDECSLVAVRYPPPVGEILAEVCEDAMGADSDAAVAQALMAAAALAGGEAGAQERAGT